MGASAFWDLTPREWGLIQAAHFEAKKEELLMWAAIRCDLTAPYLAKGKKIDPWKFLDPWWKNTTQAAAKAEMTADMWLMLAQKMGWQVEELSDG